MSRRLPLAVAALVLGAIFAPSTASAHSTCVKENPKDGSTLSAAPSEVACEFNEPLSADASSMEIVDACGRRVDDGEVAVFGFDMSVGMATDAPGEYIVRWATLSLQDGHRAFGQWLFRVAGTAPACPAAPEPTITPTKSAQASARPTAIGTPTARTTAEAPSAPTTTATTPPAGTSERPSAIPQDASVPLGAQAPGAPAPPVSPWLVLALLALAAFAAAAARREDA